MNRAFVRSTAIYAAILAASSLPSFQASACTANDFGEVVDQTAQALRELNADGAQRFQAKLKSIQQKHGLSDEEARERAAGLQDNRLSEFNREIDSLVGQMDVLSQTPNDQINCGKLEELKRVRDRLLTVMGQKSGYMLGKADVELDRPSDGRSPKTAAKPAEEGAGKQASESAGAAGKGDKLAANTPSATEEPPPVRERTPQATTSDPLAPSDKPAANVAAPTIALNPDLPQRRPNNAVAVKKGSDTENQAATPPPPKDLQQAFIERENQEPPTSQNGPQESENRREALVEPRDQGAPPISLAPPPDGAALPEPIDTTYGIEEISEAGRGIFGTVTAQFAAAINYAFQQFGRPNAYITGGEGGGAFLAGLRYGKGKLHSKLEPVRVIYWQGPSVGLDLGAEGSSALFLVYNLDDSEKLYGRFTGIGGSAYVAGGLGLNVLGKDGVIIVPIRTGLGLRLGANLAYLKFTERQTWNPF